VHAGGGEILDLAYDGGQPALDSVAEILSLRIVSQPPPDYVAASKCSGCPYLERCCPPVERGVVGLVLGIDRGLLGEFQAHGVETIGQLLERFDGTSLVESERPRGKRRMKVGGKAARILAGARAIKSGEPIVLKPAIIPAHPNYVMFDLEGMAPQFDQVEKIYIWGMQVSGEDPCSARVCE
jgi:predicted RecB family nuclease